MRNESGLETAAKTTQRRWLIGVTLFGVTLILAGPLYVLVTGLLAPAQSKKRLKAASSINQLQSSIKPLGIFIALPDGNWIAVDYQDAHLFQGRSSAVALDSEGRWYRSRKHFCGRFHVYRAMQESYREAEVDPTEIAEDLEVIDPEIYRLERAVDLNAARAILMEIGFSAY